MARWPGYITVWSSRFAAAAAVAAATDKATKTVRPSIAIAFSFRPTPRAIFRFFRFNFPLLRAVILVMVEVMVYATTQIAEIRRPRQLSTVRWIGGGRRRRH